MSIFSSSLPPTLYNSVQQASQQDIYRMMSGAAMSNKCCFNFSAEHRIAYSLCGRIYENSEDIPKIDIKEWAKEQGLKISEDGKTLTCYKTVTKKENGALLSVYDPSFEYHIGEYAVAKEFNPNQLNECAAGLHGCNINTANAFLSYGSDYTKMFLELKVDISDPDNYVIPYEYIPDSIFSDILHIRPSSKFRFRKCFVSRALNLKRVTKYVDEETGEEFEV